MSPVRIRREVEGFVFNRLQGAVLREAYCLVRDGVASAEDIDRVMREGPGRRWSILGPFEVAELNTRGGIDAHARLLGPAYARMGAERGQSDPWTEDLVASVSAAVQKRFPREDVGRKRGVAGPRAYGAGGLPPCSPRPPRPDARAGPSDVWAGLVRAGRDRRGVRPRSTAWASGESPWQGSSSAPG